MTPRNILIRPISKAARGQIRKYSAPGDGAIPPAKQKYVPTSGTYPKGFRVGTAHVGVKASNTRFDDLMVLASDWPCGAAAVFTKNKFQAAPVIVTRDMLNKRGGRGIRGVIVNSGCANAVTGKGGIEDARKMAMETDTCLSGGNQGPAAHGASSLVMSTGVIGQRLPIAQILAQIPAAVSNLGSTHNHWLSAARAICTTDTFPKLISRSFALPSYPGTTFNMAGMTKGAGMMHPNMATLLGIICTDAPLAPSTCRDLLASTIHNSFNSISIDGDTSTNDTVCLLANGAALDPFSQQVNPNGKDFKAMLAELTSLMTSLAQLVVRDGEGATKFVTIRVQGADDDRGPGRTIARRIARRIATSPLVKTALYGKDANWGRILMAIGNVEGPCPAGLVVPEKTSLSFVPLDGSAELKLVVNGEAQVVDEKRAAEVLESEDLEILVKMNGDKVGHEAVVWTCDFSHEYVTINADYRT